MASGFLVLTGQTGEGLNSALAAVRPASVTVVVMMGLAGRDEIAREFIKHGWPPDTPRGHCVRGLDARRMDLDRNARRAWDRLHPRMGWRAS